MRRELVGFRNWFDGFSGRLLRSLGGEARWRGSVEVLEKFSEEAQRRLDRKAHWRDSMERHIRETQWKGSIEKLNEKAHSSGPSTEFDEEAYSTHSFGNGISPNLPDVAC